MTLYFDTRVENDESGAIGTSIAWHATLPFLAVAWQNNAAMVGRGAGYVTIYDEQGEIVTRRVECVKAKQQQQSSNSSKNQVTALAWHPESKKLVVAWQSGDLRIWSGDEREEELEREDYGAMGGKGFVTTPHREAINLLRWSQRGSRLVSADTGGSLVGWKMDARTGQLLIVFHHELQDRLLELAFKLTPVTPTTCPTSPSNSSDISGLAKAAVAGDERALDLLSTWRPRTAATRYGPNGKSSWRLKGDNEAFYTASARGRVYYVDVEGQCAQVLEESGGNAILGLLHHQSRDSLVVVSAGYNLGYYQSDPQENGKLLEVMRLKLSGIKVSETLNISDCCWLGPNTLAILTADAVRCWDLHSSDSYVLSPGGPTSFSTSPTHTLRRIDDSPHRQQQQLLTSLSFCKSNETLAVGTNMGTVYLWKKSHRGKSIEGEDEEREQDAEELGDEEQTGGWPLWPRLACTLGTSGSAVQQLAWGAGLLRRSPLLAVNCASDVFILRQQPACAASRNGTSAYQIGPSLLAVEKLSSFHSRYSCNLKTDIQVQLVAVDEKHVVVSSGRSVEVYKIQQLFEEEGAGAVSNSAGIDCTLVANATCESDRILVHEESGTLIVLKPEGVELRSLSEPSRRRALVAALAEEGEPITAELTGPYLTVASLSGTLRLWEFHQEAMAPRASRAVANLPSMIDDFAEVIEARCNADCRFVSLTIAMANLLPSSVLYVWQVDKSSGVDQVLAFDLARPDSQGCDPALAAKCEGMLVTSHCWDRDDPRLLVCRAQRVEGEGAEVALLSMFVSSEHGIVLHDVREIARVARADEACCNASQLLAVESPYILVFSSELQKEKGLAERRRSSSSGARKSQVERLAMRDLEDLAIRGGGDINPEIKAAVLDFSYHLSVANLDEAFKAIKAVKEEAVWRSLARTCVKSKQLDMAMLCLGHMKQARSARALREAIRDSSFSLEAKSGILALHLHLYEDAERLFREAKRWDLVASLLEARNKFREATEFAVSENKIREKTCFYNYAKALEAEGKIAEAMEMYTKADCHRFEVPRMLLSVKSNAAAIHQLQSTTTTSAKLPQLETYLRNSDDPEIIKWHAQYIESIGDLEGALSLYEKARDALSVTRLLCFLGREDEARELVASSSDAASAYHLAAHYDAKNNVPQAVHFYTIAKAYTNAIRLCKENDMSEELWPLATLAPRALQLEVAKYYEEEERDANGAERAILLYHKAGMLRKALELAFETRQFNALQLVAMDVNADSDPALVEKCAEYFVRNEQLDKAVDLLALANKRSQALQLVRRHNVPITEDLAEKLALDRVEENAELERERLSNLETIGEIALEQGNYHLATKKLTQAGNKTRAMKALLKSGDTDKICFFAQVSRQREIYVMAANYLQSLDWRNQPSLVKHITTFYSKAKATEQLANFYVNCADVEVDDYRNYEKALEALNQATKCLLSSSSSTQESSGMTSQSKKALLNTLNQRMSLIRRYLEMNKQFEKGETETGMGHAQHLLMHLQNEQGDELNKAVRVGDLFASITRHYVDIGNLEKARESVEDLRCRVPGVKLAFHYGPQLLQTLGLQQLEEQKTTGRHHLNDDDDDNSQDDTIEEEELLADQL